MHTQQDKMGIRGKKKEKERAGACESQKPKHSFSVNLVHHHYLSYRQIFSQTSFDPETQF